MSHLKVPSLSLYNKSTGLGNSAPKYDKNKENLSRLEFLKDSHRIMNNALVPQQIPPLTPHKVDQRLVNHHRQLINLNTFYDSNYRHISPVSQIPYNDDCKSYRKNPKLADLNSYYDTKYKSRPNSSGPSAQRLQPYKIHPPYPDTVKRGDILYYQKHPQSNFSRQNYPISQYTPVKLIDNPKFDQILDMKSLESYSRNTPYGRLSRPQTNSYNQLSQSVKRRRNMQNIVNHAGLLRR